MRTSTKWIVTALSVYCVWILSIAAYDVVRSRRHPSPAPVRRVEVSDATDFRETTPQTRATIARNLAAPVYPEARCEFSYLQSWPNGVMEGRATLGTDAPYADVLAFYTSQCASLKPMVRTAAPVAGPRALLAWQDLEAFCTVLIRAGRPKSQPHGPNGGWEIEQPTVIELRRRPLRWRLIASDDRHRWSQRGVSPARLGLPIYPGSKTQPAARVDYSGWVYSEKGRTAVAQCDVMAPFGAVQGYYAQVPTTSGGVGFYGGGDEITLDWGNVFGQFSVVVSQPDPDLPTLIYLQHVGGGCPQALLRRYNLLPPIR